MGHLEKRAWRAFRDLVHGFLGNVRAPNYQELVANMISAFHAMGCRMSLKVHYLHSHLDFFRDNLGHVSEEHGERFHQDILLMEQRYKGHIGFSHDGGLCLVFGKAKSRWIQAQSSLFSAFLRVNTGTNNYVFRRLY